jgi:hypothetical protein
VAFDPDIAFAAMVPVPLDPTGVGVGWFHVVSGNPDVTIAVPAVVAGVPRPVRVLVGWRRDDFVGSLGRPNAYDDLGLCNAHGEKNCAGGSGKEFLHSAISLWC